MGDARARSQNGDDTPAFLSFRFACLGCLDYKGRRGRPRSNLFDLLFKDILSVRF